MFWAVGSALLIAGLAFANGQAVAGQPVHIKKMLPFDVNRYYPAKASNASIDGIGNVECTVLATGRLSACTVLAETPCGYGFGTAVAKLAMDAIIADLDRDPAGTRVTFASSLTSESRIHGKPADKPCEADKSYSSAMTMPG